MNTTPDPIFDTPPKTNKFIHIWRDLSLTRKLLFSFGFLSILLLVVGYISYLGLNRVQGSFESALSEGAVMEITATHLQEALLTARRHEKDFLLRWQVEGFDTAYENYALPNQEAVAQMEGFIEELAIFGPVVERELGQSYTQAQYETDIATLKQNLDVYDQAFHRSVQLIQERGFEDTGLEGEFRVAVHDIEALIYEREGLEPLVITMLEIRRHEKDYLLRGTQEYIDGVHQYVDELKREIASSDQITAAQKTEMTALANNYVTAFDALVEKDLEINTSIEAFREAAHTIEPLAAKLENTGVELSALEVSAARTTSTSTVLNISLALAGALLTSILLSILLPRTLSRPLQQLTEVAQQIEKGDFEARAEEGSRDEIGILATTFNSMTTQLKNVFDTLEQRVAERTKAIATSSAVSRRLSTILNQDELVKEVVNQVKDAFGYYHTHIYLLEGDDLVMAGGTGEAGAKMLASGHKIPKGRGLVGRAAESNEPVLVSFTAQDPDWLPNPLLPETLSEVAIPISVGDEVLGVLDVQHNVAGGLDQEDVDSLASIANQAAIALQNVASAETVAKRAQELETVAEISTATATIQDTTEMLATMVHLTQRGFGLYHAHVFTYQEEKEALQIVACGYKEGDEHEGTHGTTAIPIAQEQSLVARAARTRQPVIVNDVHNEPGWLPNPLLPDTQAELAVPMIVGNQLLGVLDVQSEHLNAFTEEDAHIQMTLASQVATALQNTRSFQETQKQAERETKLNLITQRIQSADTIEGALQIAARELGQALGKRQALVALDPSVLAGDGGKKVVNE